jgi:hypothetical protein
MKARKVNLAHGIMTKETIGSSVNELPIYGRD